MVRSVTFEIRWHDTQPIYSCSFQPISPSHLKRVLDHNLGQAAGLAPGKTLSDVTASAFPSSSTNGSSSAPSGKAVQPPIMAGGQSWRLATAGGDNNARLWMVHPNIPSPAALASAASTLGSVSIALHPPRVEYLATLSRHSGVVNVVRFCPKGEVLATAGDDGNVLFWVPSDKSRPCFGDSHSSLDGENQHEKEFWRVKLMTRATQHELYDMAWSPNGETLAVGGTDFVARIINAHDGHVIREISEHNHYIQGIAWDPLNEFIATQSSDRSVHVHNLHTRHKHEHAEPLPVATHIISKNHKLDLHRRNPSASASFIWDSNSKPPMQRRSSSHASQTSDGEGARDNFATSVRGRSNRSITPIDPSRSSSATAARASTPGHVITPSNPPGSGRPVTPTPAVSVPPSPFSTNSASVGATHAMNPPQMTPSRRSSFSGSNFDAASPPTSTTSLAPGSTFASQSAKLPSSSATDASLSTPVHSAINSSDRSKRGHSASRSASRTRSVRSPSPIAPLPAIRAPPSPKQRLQTVSGLVSGGQLSKATVRLYGDENFSGFFRRLAFSPDGALLVTPSGLFDPPPPPPPVSPTATRSPRKSPAVANTLSNAAGSSQTNKSAVYIYARGNLSRSNTPIAVLPGHKTATIVVRFSPILYQLRKTPRSNQADDGIPPHPTIPLEAGKQKSVSINTECFNPISAPATPAAGSSAADKPASPPSPGDRRATVSSGSPPRGMSAIGLPYRMVYAVATQDSVWIYDTQQTGPICCFSNMHYASFTDLTWSPDGQSLMMSSTDGYCSVVVFDHAELGIPHSFSAQPALKTPASGIPAPAHIAEGKSSGSKPTTPQLPAAALAEQSVSTSAPQASTTATTPIASSSFEPSPAAALQNNNTTTAGLGLAIGSTCKASSGSVGGGISTAPSLSSLHGLASATATSLSSPSTNEAPKKKRRIAPTLEQPLGQ